MREWDECDVSTFDELPAGIGMRLYFKLEVGSNAKTCFSVIIDQELVKLLQHLSPMLGNRQAIFALSRSRPCRLDTPDDALLLV